MALVEIARFVRVAASNYQNMDLWNAELAANRLAYALRTISAKVSVATIAHADET